MDIDLVSWYIILNLIVDLIIYDVTPKELLQIIINLAIIYFLVKLVKGWNNNEEPDEDDKNKNKKKRKG